MHNNKVLYSALFDGEYPFGDLFEKVTTVMLPEELVDEGGCLIIWGGGDISPSYYNHSVSRHTGATLVPDRRDTLEWDLANKAVSMGIPVIGICRGAQMMNAKSGGYLIQDVTGHTRQHEMITNKDEKMQTSSLHHQMMAFEPDQDVVMIAKSSPALSKHYIIEKEIDLEVPECEPEIVYFPQTKALCIQGHPEYMSLNSRFVRYCSELVKQYV
jgi:GMP synthase-like glutamine amidotransferase